MTVRLPPASRRSCAALAALLALTSAAEQGSPADRLRDLLEPMAHFGAEFEQVVVGARGRTLQSARGTVRVERPGRLRWEVSAPYPQLIVSDGVDLFVFDPDLAQVTVQPLAEAPRDTPGQLLTGDLDELERLFDVTVDTGNDPLQGFVLKPLNADALFDHVRLEFAGRVLAGIDIVDHLDQETHVRFHNQNLNPARAPDLFHFVVPEGADVIGDVGPP